MVNSYNSEISYQITKLPVAYDYSCGANDTGINVILTNKGMKAVTDFTVSVSNPVCAGAVPQFAIGIQPIFDTEVHCLFERNKRDDYGGGELHTGLNKFLRVSKETGYLSIHLRRTFAQKLK